MIKNFIKLVTESLTVFGFFSITTHAEVSVFWDFSPGNENGWTTVNGVSWLDANGVEAGQANGVGGNATGNTRKGHDGAHTNFIYRSPTISFGSVHPTDPVLEIDWIGGGGNQSGIADPANPAAIIGGSTTAGGSKGVALLNLATGEYDAIYYNSIQGNPGETNSLTLTDLTTAGVSTTDNYQLDFFDTDDGSWGWTRMSEVRLDSAAYSAPPPPPSETDITWDFSFGNEHGWTAVNGVSWLSDNGVEAGQEDGVGGNDTGNTRNGHDGAHVNFIYRSPVLNFAAVSDSGAVIEFDFEGGAGNQDVVTDPLNPEAIITSGIGITSAVGQKGLGFLNLVTGEYDAVYYDSTNGGGVESISLSKSDLTAAGISMGDNYQLDFLDNDDGSWGWTRLKEVRLDSTALGGTPTSIEITNIEYSPGDDLLTLTWNSREGVAYVIKYSHDMIDWSADIDDSVIGDAGTETTRSYNLNAAGIVDREKVFIRVE